VPVRERGRGEVGLGAGLRLLEASSLFKNKGCLRQVAMLEAKSV